jgi:hypothetical protein
MYLIIACKVHVRQPEEGPILQSRVCTFADHAIQIYRISDIGKIYVGLAFSLGSMFEHDELLLE